MRVQLAVNVGGSITLDPPHLAAVSSLACTVTTPAGDALATLTPSSTGQIGTLSTTAAAGDTSVTLSSVTGLVVRRRYVLRSATGDREWVRVRSWNTTTKVVTLFERLAGNYASGSTFIDNRITATLDDADAADIDEGYEAKFTYTADSVVYVHVVQFDIVRTVWPATLVATHDLRSYAPAILAREFESADSEGTDYADLIDQATERVLADIRGHGRDPSRFRSYDPFRRPVMEAALLHLALMGDNLPRAYQSNPGEWQMQRRSEYEAALSQALNVAREYDLDQDGIISEAEKAVRVTSPRIRL